MEYLMTYGWAILIIAVVLAALFSLGVFSGTNLLGQSCVASPGYLCENLVLGTGGTLSFTIGQSTGQAIYNVELACAATANANGGPGPGGTAFEPIVSGTASYATVANEANGVTIPDGGTVNVAGLTCYDNTNAALSSPALGTAFTGFLWLNYTTSYSNTPSSWSTIKIATVSSKVT